MQRFTFLSVVAYLLGLPLTVPAEPSLDQMRIENARRIMLVTEVDWEEVIDLWTDDIEYHDPAFIVYGKEEMRTFLTNLFDFMKDYRLEINEEVYQDGTYMVYWQMEGIVFDKSFVAPGLSILKFRPGEARCYFHKDLFTEGDIWINMRFYGGVVKYLRNVYKAFMHR